MDWKVLKTEDDYKMAVKRSMAIFQTEEGTPESDELDLLLVLIKDYEDKHIQLPTLDPIMVIKLKMKERGMRAKDLESVVGSKGHISSILSGRRELTLNTAIRLREYFNLPAEVFLHEKRSLSKKPSQKLQEVKKSPAVSVRAEK